MSDQRRFEFGNRNETTNINIQDCCPLYVKIPVNKTFKFLNFETSAE